MRRALDAAEPARYALLGLLLDGPRHGYDLARRFEPGSALGDVVHLSHSHLYALLARLERDGLIAGERQDDGVHPPRHVYHLSETGRLAVVRWAGEPVERPRDMHIDFPLKLYTARRLGPDLATMLIERQRALLASYIRRLESAAPAMARADAGFIALMRDGRMGRARAALDWLDRCDEVMAALR